MKQLEGLKSSSKSLFPDINCGIELKIAKKLISLITNSYNQPNQDVAAEMVTPSYFNHSSVKSIPFSDKNFKAIATLSIENVNSVFENQIKPLIDLSLKCPLHLKYCAQCTILQTSPSMKDIKALEKTFENLHLKQEPYGKKRIVFEPTFKNSVNNLFAPQNSNRASAAKSSRQLIEKWSKKDKNVVLQLDKVIMKDIQDGIATILTREEERDIFSKPHYFSFMNVALKPDSNSTPVRPIVDSSRGIPGKDTAVSLEVDAASGTLGSMLDTIVLFRLFEYCFTTDIKSAYHQIAIKGDFAKYNLLHWFEGLDLKKPMTVMKNTLSFGNPFSGGALDAGIYKYVVPKASN